VYTDYNFYTIEYNIASYGPLPVKSTYATWWFRTPLKNIKVSWDAEIPNIWKVLKIHVPNHQPDFIDVTWYFHGMYNPIEIASCIQHPA